MNLMFRKNFGGDKGATAGSERSTGISGGAGSMGIEGAGSTGGRLGGRTVATTFGGRGGAIRRSREYGYYPMDHDHTSQSHAYRTHLFLSPPAGGAVGSPPEDYGERYGPGPRRTSGPHVIKWGGGPGTNAASGTGAPNRRKPSNMQNYNEQPAQSTGQLATQTKQVSFPGNRTYGSYTPLVISSGNSPPRNEPISLATLDRDCFIIPLASVERFLPAGVPQVPSADTKIARSPLSILEVEDPKQCILAHLMSPLEPIDPIVESPMTRPLILQRDVAAELVSEIAPSASQSILLTNMEKNSDFPFISYYVINKQNTDPVDFYNDVHSASMRKFDPRDLRYATSHTLDLYNEVATIARPPLEPLGGRPPAASTAYLISIFKVFEGDDGPAFEQNWLYWTGARMIYSNLPKSVGLRRITLHKSMSQGDKTYLLICECSKFQENLTAAAFILPALRARLCGYVGLYRPSVCL